MTSISFTAINVRMLGLNQRPSRATTWQDAQLRVGWCEGRFGGVTTVVIGCTKNLSTEQQISGFGCLAFSAFITPVRGITRAVELDGLSE
jgi:hypothetical protein